MAWLCRAQDAGRCGGIPSAYDAFHGRWEAEYPETTGYLIPTFLRYARQVHDDAYCVRAARMADWLIRLQLDTGAFPALSGAPCVFDTGMILDGLTEIGSATGDTRYARAAERAAVWLESVQAPDGSWPRHDYYANASTYHAKVAASLGNYAQQQSSSAMATAVRRHIEWVISLQRDDGWFRRAAFGGGEEPWLHNVAYVIEGLWDAAMAVGHGAGLNTTRRAALRLMRMFEVRKALPGLFYGEWGSGSVERCLPGEAQMALIWLKLYRHDGDSRLLNASLKLIDELCQLQHVGVPHEGEGALAGSVPFFRGYAAWQYPNWAAKFFCDALMLEAKALNAL